MGSEPYTPTDEQVRRAWPSSSTAIFTDEALAEYDRWLAEHDARVRKEQRERDAQIAERISAGSDGNDRERAFTAGTLAAAAAAIREEKN